MPATSEARTEVQTEDQSALDRVDSDASFIPWMVASRKRNDHKGAKRNSPNSLPGNGKSQHQDKLIEPLESSGVKKVWAGPSKAKELYGKRKAQPDMFSSPSVSFSPLVDQSPTFSCGLVSSGPTQKNVESVGWSSKDLNNLKSKIGSVKGKKEIARNRASVSATTSTVSDKATSNVAVSEKTSFSTPSDWSTSISKIRTELNGEFKFSAKPDNKVGDHRGWISYGDTDWAEKLSLSTELTHGSVQSMDFMSTEHGHGSPSIDRGRLWTVGRPVVDNRSRHSSDGSVDCEANAGPRPYERNGEEDQMESDGGSEIPTSN